MTVMPAASDFNFATAAAAINAWRGRCLAAFARAEATATEMLLRLSAHACEPTVPLLVGQRFSLLAASLDAMEDQSSKSAAQALAHFRERDSLRSFLCHGDAKITIGRNGKWQAILTMTSVKRKQVCRDFLIIDECEAEAIATALWRDQSSFANAVRMLAPIEGSARRPSLRIGRSQD